METKRPQLNLDELHQLKWLLGGVLTLLAVWTVFYMDVEAWELTGLTTLAAGACLIWPTLPARVPPLAHVLAFPVIVAVFVADLWLTAEVLPAMVRLDILLLLYRGVSYRQRRDDLQVIVLGLFLIVVAGVLTVSLAFAVQLMFYTACALAFLLAVTLVATAEEGGGESGKVKNLAPAWAVHTDWRRLARRVREVADWRVVAVASTLFIGVVAISALLFVAIPRFQLENSLFLERFMTKKTRTGFNETIRFGDVSGIQQDTSVALSVDVSDRSVVPAAPYWRMLVLDQYDSGVFRFSPLLQRATLAAERTDSVVHGDAKPKRGATAQWTFYLESDVSRYLPLLGRFELLRFREPQNYRFGLSAGVLALRDAPLSMTAYRVDGFEISASLPDPTFPSRRRERAALLALPVTPDERATLARTLGEFVGRDTPAKLAVADFSHRVGAWLRQNHGYSLTPTIPRGDGDPLVRWLTSHEAGHCELFAGSLVLLARAQNLPARIVTGFRGGTWNAYSNNFSVRNSDAHAWAEIYDEANGVWLRADALEQSITDQTAAQGEAAIARRTDDSWSARLDSLRVFWYRRIVNFDQRSQLETLRGVKETAQNSGKRVREAVAAAIASLKAWLAEPWNLARGAKLLGLALGLIATWWAWRWHLRDVWRQLVRGVGGQREDPVRREASRWLVKISRPESRTAEHELVIADLQRLRYGAPQTWPEPEKTFRRAKQAARAARRISRS